MVTPGYAMITRFTPDAGSSAGAIADLLENACVQGQARSPELELELELELEGSAA